jgi:plastocyanin
MRRGPGLVAVMCVAAAIALPATAAAATRTIYAGVQKGMPKTAPLSTAFKKQYQPDANAFFAHQITINAGDTIKFMNNGGHTIDIPAKGGSDLPLILAGTTVSGDNDAAGNPFWFNGKVPALGLNPQVGAPTNATLHGGTYNGSARVDSGLFNGNGNPPPFNVKFTKPGTYKFFCDIHPGMLGTVVVLAKGKPIPSAAQDTAAVKAQLDRDNAIVKHVASTTKPPANSVSLGASGADGVELFTMFPSTLKVKAGTVVTFFMSKDTRETHTATFGPSSYLNMLSNSLGSPSMPQQFFYPSDPPGSIVLTPTSHGNGFASTGALDRDPTTPLQPSGKIKFTKPGTYHFQCLIHPFMHGTVVVS